MTNKIFKTAFSEYTLIEQIGEGGSSVVYKVRDENGANYAIKVLPKNKGSQSKRKRFENEYKFCNERNAENIIKYLGNGLDGDGNPFIVMPLYEGSLRKFMPNLIESEKQKIILGILTGVEFAHFSNTIHRDLKPENILLTKDKIPIVADFGIAHFHEDDMATFVETKPGDRIANFQYSAPEQKNKSGNVGIWSDIYAIGLMINELFTGNVISGSKYKTISEASSDNAFLDEIVEKMVLQDYTKRYSNIDEIKSDIFHLGKIQVERKRLSVIQEKVIGISDIDDPLVLNPPKIIDINWEFNTLTIKMSHSLNYDWNMAKNNFGEFQYLEGFKPEKFHVQNNEILVEAPESAVESIFNHFQQWLPFINKTYEEKKRADNNERLKFEQMNRERQIRETKKRLDILSKIKLT